MSSGNKDKPEAVKMSDLARLAGVSKSTVSRALANSDRVKPETRKLIHELAEKLNYRMDTRARNFRLKSVLTIGVLLPSVGHDNWLATNPFILELIGALSDKIDSHGHELLLAKHNNCDPAWLQEFVYTRSVDGVIVIGQSFYHHILNDIAENYSKMVVWGAHLPDQNYITVGTDNYKAGRLVANHLLETQRRQFLFVGDTNTPESHQRLQGFRDTIAELSHTSTPRILKCADYSNEGADDFLEKDLENYLNQVDAIFASNDSIAIKIIQKLHKAGLSIPDDISVVGYDNINLSGHLNPGLTTVEQDRRLAACLLVEKLLDLINGKQVVSTCIPAKLVARDSA